MVKPGLPAPGRSGRHKAGVKAARNDEWYISKPKDADDALIREDQIDLATLGRPLLAEPCWPYRAAKELGVDNAAPYPNT